MKIIEWLNQGDYVIKRLVSKYLLDRTVTYQDEGYIKRYLDLFDSNTNMWGNGIYSPKWISTHYTLLELKYMEINPSNPIYIKASLNLLDKMWINHGEIYKNRYPDMCVVAMILGIITYGEIQNPKVNEMVDYILSHQFLDGGWNCLWMDKNTSKSSLHTTISVLEAFFDYEENGYTYRIDDIREAIPKAWEFILKKKLFRSVRTNEIIHPDMIEFHYPQRWKYDAFRALEYFARIKHPYDERMKEAFQILFHKLEKVKIPLGKQYSGLIHFRLEKPREGRFNTFRALKILKFYYLEKYMEIINKELDN